jgi:hypothetical protein
LGGDQEGLYQKDLSGSSNGSSEVKLLEEN